MDCRTNIYVRHAALVTKCMNTSMVTQNAGTEPPALHIQDRKQIITRNAWWIEHNDVIQSWQIRLSPNTQMHIGEKREFSKTGLELNIRQIFLKALTCVIISKQQTKQNAEIPKGHNNKVCENNINNDMGNAEHQSQQIYIWGRIVWLIPNTRNMDAKKLTDAWNMQQNNLC